MRILVLGSGGREHALVWKLSQSEQLTKLFIAPGNAGTADFGLNVDLNPLNFEEVAQFVDAESIDMLVVGPEEPLVNGIADFFLSHSRLSKTMVIGPSKAGAMLEGSKDFAKQFMQGRGIPTAAYRSFHKEQLSEALHYLNSIPGPYVLKASGLAAGKGVVISENLEHASEALTDMMQGKFGDAGSTVVIEEFLSGEECSVFVLTDGKDMVLLPEAKDHKRIGEGDTGLNTGGMGAFSPVPFCDEVFMEKVMSRIIVPTIAGLKAEEITYKGFIFFGLIKVNNEPYVIEYNCRLGDPETEVILPRLETDLLELFQATWNGTLHQVTARFSTQHCATVMVVSGGYPESYNKGFAIAGLDGLKGEMVFHAGTKESENTIQTNGGRVLAFSATGNTLDEALLKAYKNIEHICFEHLYFRKDIGRGYRLGDS